jgi:hypothetical protein
LLQHAVDHIQRLVTSEAPIREVKVIDAEYVGGGVDDTDPETVPEQDVLGGVGKGVSELILGCQAFRRIK